MLLSVFKIFFCLLVITIPQTSFEGEQREWREQRDRALRAEDGWLSVSGLFWLKKGINTFGTGKNMDIVLPAGSAPENIGTLELGDGVVMLRVADGVDAVLPPKAIKSFEMRFGDNTQMPPFLVGSLRLNVIKRGDRYGLRVKDKNSVALREFKGLEWFPARESYRVVATFTPFVEPKEMIIMNVLGDELKMKVPGLLTFELNGRTHQLRPVVENDEKLFIIFRDQTAGKTTYGAGRYLYADLPKDGKVVLDFNRAENPPCAFTLYATCPLPPRQNFLPIPIHAGERAFHLKTKKS